MFFQFQFFTQFIPSFWLAVFFQVGEETALLQILLDSFYIIDRSEISLQTGFDHVQLSYFLFRFGRIWSFFYLLNFYWICLLFCLTFFYDVVSIDFYFLKLLRPNCYSIPLWLRCLIYLQQISVHHFFLLIRFGLSCFCQFFEYYWNWLYYNWKVFDWFFYTLVG